MKCLHYYLQTFSILFILGFMLHPSYPQNQNNNNNYIKLRQYPINSQSNRALIQCRNSPSTHDNFDNNTMNLFWHMRNERNQNELYSNRLSKSDNVYGSITIKMRTTKIIVCLYAARIWNATIKRKHANNEKTHIESELDNSATTNPTQSTSTRRRIILPSPSSSTSSTSSSDLHRENMKKKQRREMEQVSMDAASDLLDTDSNTTFAMVFMRRCFVCYPNHTVVLDFVLNTLTNQRETQYLLKYPIIVCT